MTFHGPTRADQHDLQARAREPAGDAGAARDPGARRRRRRRRRRRSSSARASTSSGARRSSTASDNHILHALHEVPDWVRWAPTIAMAAGFAHRLPLLHRRAVAAGADRARLPPALSVPAQQVVLRRALRPASSCARRSGSATCCGRSATSDHQRPDRRHRGRRLSGHGARGAPADRLHLPLRLRHADRRWRCSSPTSCSWAGRARWISPPPRCCRS